MNVYITGTNEIPTNLIVDVFTELNQSKGVINFIPKEVLNKIELRGIDPIFSTIDHTALLSFETYFNVCNVYRELKEIENNDFVVLLTSYRHDQNWFSATKHRNIFIDINDWDQFTGKNPKYGISYQVVENIFQSLIGIDHDIAEKGHPNIHKENDGCINDLCQEKRKVMIKLRTADICPSCQDLAAKQKVEWSIMNHIQIIMLSVCKNVRSLNTNKEVKLEKVKIDKRGNIKIGEKEISMKGLPSALFILFLLQQKPIKKTSLKNLKETILKIYERVDGKGNQETIEKLIDPNGKAFRHNKWYVNDVLENNLTESLLGYYIIDEVEEMKYYINLSEEYKEINSDLFS